MKRGKLNSKNGDMNKMKKVSVRKNTIILIIILTFSSLLILGLKINNSTSSTQKQKYIIHDITRKMMEYFKIDKCYITKLPNYRELSIIVKNPFIEETEVNAYIDRIRKDFGIQELSLDFVKQEFHVASLEEFYDKVKERISEGKEVDALISARNQAKDILINESRFQLDQKVVAQYSLEVVKSYEDEAFLNNMTLDDYINTKLKMGKKEFYSMCYEEGTELIEYYLLVGAIAEKEGFTVTEEEMLDYDYYQSEIGKEDKIYIGWQILENKIYELVLEKELG